MLTKARRVATVTAANVVDLFILTGDKLNGTLEEFPQMRAIMEKVALNRLLKLREKVYEFCIFSFSTYLISLSFVL